MAQSKKMKKPQQVQQKRRMPTSQKVMAIIGVLIILAMLSGPILSLLSQ